MHFFSRLGAFHVYIVSIIKLLLLHLVKYIQHGYVAALFVYYSLIY